MSSRTTLKTEAQQAVLATTIIATGLHAALNNLDVALAGWPTKTPGAGPQETPPVQPCRDDQCTHIRPCPDHDDTPDRLTPLESAAIQGDQARHAHDQLARDIHHLANLTRRIANTITAWAHPGLTDTEIRRQLVAVDATIWCRNCTRYGRHEPRAPGIVECDFCARFRRDYKVACPKEIWDARDARGGRIDLTTIERILKRVKQDRAEAKRAAAKATKEANAKAGVT